MIVTQAQNKEKIFESSLSQVLDLRNSATVSRMSLISFVCVEHT